MPPSPPRNPPRRIEVGLAFNWIYGDRIWSPIPRIALPVRTAKGAATVKFLVDTGADISVISQWTADARGIPYDRKRRFDCAGPWGKSEGYLNTVDVMLFDSWHQVPVVVVCTASALEPILGRPGIIDRFVVSVGRGKLIIEAE